MSFVSLQHVQELEAHLQRGYLPSAFHFQGLITLLAVSFSQNLWPIFQGQALMGFSLQSFYPFKEFASFQSHGFLAVYRRSSQMQNIGGILHAPTSKLLPLWKAVLANRDVWSLLGVDTLLGFYHLWGFLFSIPYAFQHFLLCAFFLLWFPFEEMALWSFSDREVNWTK